MSKEKISEVQAFEGVAQYLINTPVDPFGCRSSIGRNEVLEFLAIAA